jgi:hypothetical protein
MEAGDAALTDTLNADELRDRVVHDMWIERASDEGDRDGGVERWQAMPKTGGLQIHASDLDFVDRAENQLRRSAVRIMELAWYVGTLMMPDPPSDWPEGAVADPSDLLAVVQGRFDLLANGGYRPTGNQT